MWRPTKRQLAYGAVALLLSMGAMCNACDRDRMAREGCFDAVGEDGKVVRRCNEPAYAPEPDGPPADK